MSFKRLPGDDLAVAKPEGPRALALVSDLTRLDPPSLDLAKSDHDRALCQEAVRDDAWPQVLISRFKPIADLVVTAQARAARGLQLNLGVVQREKLVDVVSPVEQVDPSACDRDIRSTRVAEAPRAAVQPHEPV